MKVKEPYSTVMYIVLGIILAFAINNGLALALSTDLPIVAVESGSMRPTFDKGDILLLQGQDSYAIRDIIVFSPTPGATPVVHRIITINPDGTYQTKGDANSNQLPFEKSIRQDQIHGKVILILPYLGWVKVGITQYVIPNIIIIAIIAILIYIITIGVNKLWRG